MRVTIFGSGAMAMLLGARLGRAGAAVTLAGSWRECLEAIRRDGVEVEEADGGTWKARAAVIDLRVTPRRRHELADLVLVLVKSYQTRDVAPHVARSVAAGGSVVTLQNGLGNAEVLTGAGALRVARGVTSQGAAVLGPGRVRDGGAGLTTLPAVERAPAELLRGAGFECELASDPEPRIWLKLAVNCAINPLTACERVPNGRLLERARLRRTMEQAAREVGALATARGIELPADPVREATRVAFRTAGNRSSMLQDLDRGARTEVDAISGAVVEAGERLGMAMPVNATLWERVRACDRTPTLESTSGGLR